MGRRNRDLQRERRIAAARASQPAGTRRGAKPDRKRASGSRPAVPEFLIDFIAIFTLGLLFVFLLREVGVRNYFLAVIIALVVAKVIVTVIRNKFF